MRSSETVNVFVDCPLYRVAAALMLRLVMRSASFIDRR